MLNKKAFTLVELIVVITILAILGTIAFISLQGYSSSARDSTRLSDIGSIKKVLELYSLDKGKYPEPTIETYSVTYSGAEVWTQGNYGEETLKETKRISNIPLDPLTKTPYAYSLLNTKKEYEIGAAFEGELSKLKNTKTNADGTKILTSYITGNYNGKVAKVEIGTTTYVLAVPTIINSRLDLEDYQDIANNQALAIKGSNTIAGSYTGTEVKLDGINQKVINENNIVIFEGDLENIDSKTFVENMQGAYSGTETTTNEVENLLSIDINNTEEVNNYANNVISNSLDSNSVVNKNSGEEVYTRPGSESNPGTSCKNLLDLGVTDNGTYWIDPVNNGTGFKTYCDMDNGGYTLVSYSKSPFSLSVWNNASGEINSGSFGEQLDTTWKMSDTIINTIISEKYKIVTYYQPLGLEHINYVSNSCIYNHTAAPNTIECRQICFDELLTNCRNTDSDFSRGIGGRASLITDLVVNQTNINLSGYGWHSAQHGVKNYSSMTSANGDRFWMWVK